MRIKYAQGFLQTDGRGTLMMMSDEKQATMVTSLVRRSDVDLRLDIYDLRRAVNAYNI